ncbi:major facilitator superfamily transporter [Colletotrichum simmondsii]|uniref:Major facilitator superfamily transporter n=1 Tax=Colletotrichum simmondsii TaxID=703756 RepID=A0A135S2M5_9PEZI|nr:major facilitator superfamily transporter [Colletotrichum simmondsii]
MSTTTTTATASASASTSGIELHPLPANISQKPSPYASTSQNVDDTTDPILQASREADSTVPEGGYGWVVVGGCFIVAWWIIGTSYSWGVIQGALIEDGLGTPAVLSFVGSLAAALISALAIINSRVMRRIGPRKTGLLGISLLGIVKFMFHGELSSANQPSASSFVADKSIQIVSVVPAQYFSRKRGLANGIVFAGGGLGGAVNSFALDALLNHLGSAWAYRVLALVTLATGLPAAWLIKERVPVRSTGFVEWRLFKSLTFVLVFLAGAVGTFPLFVPPFFLPLYSKSIGLSSSTGAGLVAGFNFSSAIGRICCGAFCDAFGALNVLFVSLFLSAVSILAIWPVSTSLVPMVAFVIINGVSNGGFFSTMPTVVGNTFGSARVSVAMSMIVTGWAGGYLMGSPIAGYLLEAYGGAEGGLQAYRPAMFYAGSLSLAAAGLVAMVRLRINSSILAKI